MSEMEKLQIAVEDFKNSPSMPIEKAVIGSNKAEYNRLDGNKKKLASEIICIFYTDGTAQIFDLTDIDIENRGLLIDAINYKIRQDLENIENYNMYDVNDKRFKESYAKADAIINSSPEIEEEENEKKDAARAALIALAALIGVGGLVIYDKYHKPKENETKQNNEFNNTNIEELQETPSIYGKDFAFYSENALETNQKSLTVKAHSWLSQFETESWGKVVLTEEQMEKYGLANPECTFGLTAEEAYSLSLRFGHFTNDEYVTLTGGANIDTVNTIDTANNAMNSIRTYYICSDECDLNIEQLINFNEKELAKVNEIEAMFAEWKVLAKDETKEKEAFEKMQEIKKWWNEFANTMDPELDSAKSYLLRTILPACSIVSEIYQYQDKESIDVYDTKNDVYKTLEIKTALFDELMMRNLVEGFDKFDEVKFLKENDISSSRYTLRLPDKPRSFADDYCSGEIEKLNQANSHINALRTENTVSEAAFAGSITVNPESDVKIGDQVVSQMDNVNTRFDQLTEGTYVISQLLELINNDLKEQGLYPENQVYFLTAKRSELQMEYNSKHGVTQGQKGDEVTTKKEVGKTTTSKELTAPNAIVTDSNGNQTTPQQAMEEARKETEKATGQVDASTPEASQKADEQAQKAAAERAAMLQNVYTQTYEYFYAGDANGYNSSWASSSDGEVASRYNAAKADAENRRNVEAEVNRKNQEQNAQTQPTPAPTPEQTKPVEPAPSEPTQPVEPSKPTAPEENVIPDDVIIDPEFQDAIITTVASNDEYYTLDELGLTEDEFKSIIKVKTV